MKKQNIIYKSLLALLFISVLFITACSDVFNNSEKSDKAIITISLEQSESRTVIPVYDFESFTNFTLTGIKNNNTEILGNWNTYADLESADIKIDTGSWDFTLTAKKDNENFTGTTTAEVTSGETVSLSFKLVHGQSESKGAVDLTVRYPVSSEIVNVAYIFRVLNGNVLENALLSGDQLSTGKVEIARDSLDAGEYLLDCRFFGAAYNDSNPEANKIGSYNEIIVVESGFETKLDVSLPYLLDPNGDVFDGIVNNPASAYTYPEKSIYPVYINSTQSVPETETAGTTESAVDNTATYTLLVTPQSNGLKIETDFTETSWKYVSVYIKNITRNSRDIEVVLNSNVKTSGLVYPFTKSGDKYQVWLVHQDDGWSNWGWTRNYAVEVTAIGGMGNFNVENNGFSFTKSNIEIYLNELSVELPLTADALESSVNEPDTPKWNVRFEKGTKWGDGPSYEFSIPYAALEVKNRIPLPQEARDLIADSDELFVIMELRSQISGLEVKQQIFSNQNDGWVSAREVSESAAKLPVIKIESTENNHNIEFASLPIAHHVKDAQRSWNDLSNVNVPDPWYEKCKITAIDEDGNTTSVSETDAEVKVRGNWTTNYDKKSLRIKFDKKQNMLGLNTANGNDGKYKNWVLLAGWKDASLLRDASGLKMFKTLFPEYYASDCKLVEVYINDVYWGVYLLAEQQETKSGRIAITEAEKNSTNTDIGYLIEFDQYYTSEVSEEVFTIDYRGEIKDYYGTTLIDPQAGYTIKSDVYSTEQRDFIAGYMNKLWKLCREAAYNKKYYKFNDEFNLVEYTPAGDTDDEKCRNCISEVIDIKSLADMYIFNELICDPDLYLTSFFMNIDFAEGKDHKLRFEAPWDFDSTMGNKRHIANAQGMFAGKVQQNVNYDAATEGYANPWMVIFIKQAWFQNLVKSEWADRNSDSAKNTVCNFIDDSVTNYGTRLEFNRTKWGDPRENGELNQDSSLAAATSQAYSATYLKDWLTARFTAVNTLINSLNTN